MKHDDKNDNWKLGEYSYSVDKKTFKEAYREKVGYKTKLITIAIIIAIISRLIFIFYPLDLEHIAGIKNVTADDISSIYLEQIITIPKDMDIETKEISMDDIGKKLDELWPLPLSEYSEWHQIVLPKITDKSFIEEVLLTLSNHTMRKRSGGWSTFPIDNSVPRSTIIIIRFNDVNRSQVNICIDHDPRSISIHKAQRDHNPGYYKLYGDGIDTKKLFELTRKFK